MPYSYDAEIQALTNDLLGISNEKSRTKLPEYQPQGNYEVIPKELTDNQQFKALQSEEYKAKRKYEKKYGNVVSENPYGEVGTTQYTNPGQLQDTGII
jgi:hypothetical protein